MRLSLFLVTILVPLVLAQDACEEAVSECDWEFLDVIGVPTFDFEDTDVPWTPQVVHKNSTRTIGILNSNGVTQEFIMGDGAAIPITAFGKPPFTPEYFKPYAIPRVMGSAVGIQVAQGNQATVVRGRCVKAYFSHFQRLRNPIKGPPRVVNVEVKFRNRKCVIFKTAA